MNTPKKSIGIWMDHSSAHLLEFTIDPIETTTIESAFTHESKEQSLEKSEHLMHNKEQQQQLAYYKKLGKEILNYERVLLFGPTNAKVELFNILKADEQFKHVNIEMQQAEKMTVAQERALVRKHFSRM